MNAREKGKRGERQVASWLNDFFAENLPHIQQPVFKRNLQQSMEGGHDLLNDLGLAVEVKRQETLHVEQWWKQCIDQANRLQGSPVLIWRRNGERKWNVKLRLGSARWRGVEIGKNIDVVISQDEFEQFLVQYFSGK